MNHVRWIVGSALLVALLAGCSSSSPPAAEPAPVGAETDLGTAPPAAPGQDTPAADPVGTGACYVVEVNGEAGCWDTAAAACASAGCAEDACACTEATTRNSCSC